MPIWLYGQDKKKQKNQTVAQCSCCCIKAIIIIMWKPSLFLHPPLYYCTNVSAVFWFWSRCFLQSRVEMTFCTGETHREGTDSIKYTWDNKNGNNSETASTLPWLKLLVLCYVIVIHSVFLFCVFCEGSCRILFAKVTLFFVLQRLHFSFHVVKSYTEQV